MWLLKRKIRLSFNSNEEFYDHIDSLIARLRELNLAAPAQELYTRLHEVAWATTSELLGELKLVLVGIKAKYRGQLPREVEQDITACVGVIDAAWNRANGRT